MKSNLNVTRFSSRFFIVTVVLRIMCQVIACNYVGRYVWNTPYSWFINRFLLFSLRIPYRWIIFTCKYAAVIYINKPQPIQ